MYYKLIRHRFRTGASQPCGKDGKAVRGHLYSVEHRFSRSAGIYREYLTEIAPTLENADCLIPALIYKLQVTRSPKFGKLLPELVQVPNRTGIRIIGVPDAPCFLGPPQILICGRRMSAEHSKGCILIPDAAICEQLTNTLLQEQQHKEPIYLEIYESPKS